MADKTVCALQLTHPATGECIAYGAVVKYILVVVFRPVSAALQQLSCALSYQVHSPLSLLLGPLCLGGPKLAGSFVLNAHTLMQCLIHSSQWCSILRSSHTLRSMAVLLVIDTCQ